MKIYRIRILSLKLLNRLLVRSFFNLTSEWKYLKNDAREFRFESAHFEIFFIREREQLYQLTINVDFHSSAVRYSFTRALHFDHRTKRSAS